MEKYVLILAGGTGKRFQSDLPKQFIKIHDKPILIHTFEAFLSCKNTFKYVLVLPKEHIQQWQEIIDEYQFSTPHQVVEGGKERFYSVKNGLSCVEDDALVAIHDSVRPVLSTNLIANLFLQAEKHKAAVPVVSIPDTLRLFDEKGSKVLNRNLVKRVQTPQVFYSTLIKKAYNQNYSAHFTDDASVWEAWYSKKIYFVQGENQNIKITYPQDVQVASIFLA